MNPNDVQADNKHPLITEGAEFPRGNDKDFPVSFHGLILLDVRGPFEVLKPIYAVKLPHATGRPNV